MVDAPIRRRNLREEVVVILRRRLTTGELVPGQRINESQLSAALGVSRTPLREALLHMEKEGLVVSEPARGFLAAPLSINEAREVFSVLAGLECLALRTSGSLVMRRMAELHDLQAAYEEAPDAATAAELDARWHERLSAACWNRRLLEVTGQYRGIAARYLAASGSVRWPHAASLVQHRAVLDSLDSGDIESAVAALERHWAGTTRELLSGLSRAG